MNKMVVTLRAAGYSSLVWVPLLIIAWFRPRNEMWWRVTFCVAILLAIWVTFVTFTQARHDVRRRAEARRPASPPLSIFERPEATFVVNPEVGNAGLSGFTAAALRE